MPAITVTYPGSPSSFSLAPQPFITATAAVSFSVGNYTWTSGTWRLAGTVTPGAVPIGHTFLVPTADNTSFGGLNPPTGVFDVTQPVTAAQLALFNSANGLAGTMEGVSSSNDIVSAVDLFTVTLTGTYVEGWVQRQPRLGRAPLHHARPRKRGSLTLLGSRARNCPPGTLTVTANSVTACSGAVGAAVLGDVLVQVTAPNGFTVSGYTDGAGQVEFQAPVQTALTVVASRSGYSACAASYATSISLCAGTGALSVYLLPDAVPAPPSASPPLYKRLALSARLESPAYQALSAEETEARWVSSVYSRVPLTIPARSFQYLIPPLSARAIILDLRYGKNLTLKRFEGDVGIPLTDADGGDGLPLVLAKGTSNSFRIYSDHSADQTIEMLAI